MSESDEKLKQRIQVLEEENDRLSGVIKANGFFEEEKNPDYPLHNIWLESGEYEGFCLL